MDCPGKNQIHFVARSIEKPFGAMLQKKSFWQKGIEIFTVNLTKKIVVREFQEFF